jgi:Lhr-like helicase
LTNPTWTGAHLMDVFDLNRAVIEDYERFARSFTKVRAPDINDRLGQLYAGRRFWPEPLIQISPRFKAGGSVAEFVRAGALVPRCADIFIDQQAAPDEPDRTLKLHLHQRQALNAARQGQSFVVTTGTGSGKSLCYFIPIIDAALRARAAGEPRRTRAIVVYPMNALANSQEGELCKFLGDDPAARPVSFALYTGQEKQARRDEIAANPPDILLTNFMMLELLMTRQDDTDKRVMENCAGLSFLVLDELHTYRGRQGADVAMLVRRVRERLVPDGISLQCIGTSATMASEGPDEDRAATVADVATTLFATTIAKDTVIRETLERATDPRRTAESVRPELAAAVTECAKEAFGGRRADADIARHPLAIWIETTLGLAARPDGTWERAKPHTVAQAADALRDQAGCSPDEASVAIRNCLLAASQSERQRTARGSDHPFFAFRLHQFVSGAGKLYATVDPAGARKLHFDGQQRDPDAPEKRLYAVHFCRSCGQEFHPVTVRDEAAGRVVLARDIEVYPAVADDEDAVDDDGRFGFLMPEPDDPEFRFEGRPEDYPEAWIEAGRSGELRLRPAYRKHAAERLLVAATGEIDGPGAIPAWFLPGHFRFCPACGEAHEFRGRDINRLAGLTAEGRSSATTMLVASTLRWMNHSGSGVPVNKRKLLGFTDNRQDAALQAGHFNDFVFVSLLRAGFLRALADAGPTGISEDRLGEAMQRALGFTRAHRDRLGEWLADPELLGVQLLRAEETLRGVLAHRIWVDQRRGWRYTNPSLEDLGLISAEYLGIDELLKDTKLFETAPDPVRHIDPTKRRLAFSILCDALRRGLAVHARALDDAEVEALKSRSAGAIRLPWGIGGEESPRRASFLIIAGATRQERPAADEAIILRGGRQSALGRELSRSTIWSHRLTTDEYRQVLLFLLGAGQRYGVIVSTPTPFGRDVEGWRLAGQAVQFRAANNPSPRLRNSYFTALYCTIADVLAQAEVDVFGYEAREHTAQVDNANRAVREQRFRYGDDDRKELGENVEELRKLGESGRFLPTLFCSPTMELGVDISSLNAVYLRNVPPTPANYAQRSGRAGRSGQAAMVLTYCAAQSPHDQYFFSDPAAMVQGVVRPPALDLANRDLVESHLHAVWLAATGEPLSPRISDILDLTAPGLPVRPELMARMTRAEVVPAATRRILRVLDQLDGHLTPDTAPWFQDRAAFARDITNRSPARFDAAFGRWRDLFESAERLRREADRILGDHSSRPDDRRAAKAQYRQAVDQVELLKQGSEAASSDFFTYRYLATEALLPGYNFPRLPLMAYIPGSSDGNRKQTFLQRARFIAIGEFGPRSLIYHEGRAYRVTKAILKPESAIAGDGKLPTVSIWVCRACGGGHQGEKPEACHACGAALGQALLIRNVYRIDNVDTWPAERITANDEDRQRQGFELQTTFTWATRDGRHDITTAEVTDAEGTICRLSFGAGATLRRLNLGLRRRRDKQGTGFLINPRTGWWAKAPDEDGPAPPDRIPPQTIVPAVEDRKHALLLRFPGEAPPTAVVATLQQALLRGIEAIHQVEESEILVEALPNREARHALLFYEAAEGGAGVLTRLATDTGGLARIAAKALEIMHFTNARTPGVTPADLASDPNARCVKGCYRCLLSYYNQPDHELIDRQGDEVKRFLLRLAHSRTVPHGMSSSGLAATVTADARNTGWRTAIALPGAPAPDHEPLAGLGALDHAVWRNHYALATLEALPPPLRTDLEGRGMIIVVFGADPSAWPARQAELARALGLTESVA